MVFRNNVAMYLWGFALFFANGAAMFTYIFIRDGAPRGYEPLLVFGVILVFWLVAIGLCASAFSKPRIIATLNSDGSLVVIKHYLYRRAIERIEQAEVSGARVVEEKDDDGDRYYYSRVFLKNATYADIAEGRSLENAQATSELFNSKLGK